MLFSERLLQAARGQGEQLGSACRYQLSRFRNNWYYSDSRVIPTPAPRTLDGPVAWDDALW